MFVDFDQLYPKHIALKQIQSYALTVSVYLCATSVHLCVTNKAYRLGSFGSCGVNVCPMLQLGSYDNSVQDVVEQTP